MNDMEQSFKSKKYPGPVAAGIFFSLTTIFMIYGAVILPFKNPYLRSGMGEVIFVLLPALIFLAAGRYNLKDTLKLRRTKPINYVIVVFMMMFALPVVGVLNAIVLGIIRLFFGRNLPIPKLNVPDVPTLLIALLVIGVSAAVCEETLFRGLISKSYSCLGTVGSLALTSALFGILHRDLQKVVGTALLGALIGFIVHRTKSIYAGMAAHFINNAIAVFLTYGSAKMVERMGNVGVDQIENFDFSKIPTASLVIVVVFYGILFLGCLGGFIGLMYAFIKSTEVNFTQGLYQSISHDREKKFGVAAVISVLPGVILIFFIFIRQILELMNVKSGALFDFLRTIGLS